MVINDYGQQIISKVYMENTKHAHLNNNKKNYRDWSYIQKIKFKPDIKMYARRSNLYNKVMISRRLDCWVSVNLNKKLWSQFRPYFIRNFFVKPDYAH